MSCSISTDSSLFDFTQVSDNGYVTFSGLYNDNLACPLPCADVPIIAPLWIDLDFQSFGVLYYRESQDPEILERVKTTVTQTNPTLSSYQPTLAVIVTWFQGMPAFSLTVSVIHRHCLSQQTVHFQKSRLTIRVVWQKL